MTIRNGRNSCIQVSVIDGNDVFVVALKKGAHATKNYEMVREAVNSLMR